MSTHQPATEAAAQTPPSGASSQHHIRPSIRRRRGNGRPTGGCSGAKVSPSSVKGSGNQTKPTAHDGFGELPNLDDLVESTRRQVARLEIPSGVGGDGGGGGGGRGGGPTTQEGGAPRTLASIKPKGKGSKGTVVATSAKKSKPKGILKSNPKHQGRRLPPSPAVVEDAIPSSQSCASSSVVSPTFSSSGAVAPPCSAPIANNDPLLTRSLDEELMMMSPEEEEHMMMMNGSVEETKSYMKELVVERDLSMRDAAEGDYMSPVGGGGRGGYEEVEGYRPSTTTAAAPKTREKKKKTPPRMRDEGSGSGKTPSSPPSDNDDQNEMVVLRSVSELASYAEKLSKEAREGIDVAKARKEKKKQKTQRQQKHHIPEEERKTIEQHEDVIEADMSFACMTREEYDETVALASSMGFPIDEKTGEIRVDNTKSEDGNDDDDEEKIEILDDNDDDDDVHEGDLFEDQEAESNVRPCRDFDEEQATQAEASDDKGPKQPRSAVDVFFGRQDYFPSDEEGGGEDEEDDDAMWTMTDDDSMMDLESMPKPEPRAFMKLWGALSSWITPETAAFLSDNNNNADDDGTELHPPVDRTDIGASRCAGLMSLIKMHLPKCLSERKVILAHIDTDDDDDDDRAAAATTKNNHDDDGHEKHIAELRLGRLIRTFDFTEPMKFFDSAVMWRAMTSVLLDIVSGGVNNDNVRNHVPSSVEGVGVTKEEYRYLIRSAIPSLSSSLGG